MLEEFRRSRKAVFSTTGAGESSLARYLMLSLLTAYGCGNASIIYIDPNGDDALKLLKLIPEECIDNVVYVHPRTIKLFRSVIKVNFLEYRDDSAKVTRRFSRDIGRRVSLRELVKILASRYVRY